MPRWWNWHTHTFEGRGRKACGFKSRPGHIKGAVSSVVERLVYTEKAVGPNPAPPTVPLYEKAGIMGNTPR